MCSNLQDWQKKLTDYFSKQEGQNYPCSNQTVLCGFCTSNFKEWEKFRDSQKDYIKKQKFSITLKNGEKWNYINSYLDIKGYRLYKVLVDKTLDEKIINEKIVVACVHYCKSFKWF